MAVFETNRDRVSRLIVTGAAGKIGSLLKGRLDEFANEVVLSDRKDLPATGSEVSKPCDLTDLASVRSLLHGGGDVLHFGGQSVEAPFETLCAANLVGTYNLYEAARLEGVRRVLFASSNHVTGFYPRETLLDADTPPKPDTLYGASKLFGEGIARLYYDKFGIESLILRIGSCLEKPSDRRHLATWLSPEDLIALIERVLNIPRLGCPIVYGVSKNTQLWWDNQKTQYLGWKPQDTSETWRSEIEQVSEHSDTSSPEARFQGGVFAGMAHPDTSENDGGHQ